MIVRFRIMGGKMITLSPKHEDLIEQAMRTGAYEGPDDVIGRALEMLRSEEEWLQEHKTLIHDKIERAFEQFEKGEFFTAEKSRADMEKRKAAWLADRKP